MKNQYFGDINDYFKYGMLRAFGRELSIAVIWMMTPDDGSRDGRKLEYLDHEGRRSHDPELFDWLRAWKRAGTVRDVRLIEESGLLTNCRFFNEVVPEGVAARAEWFARAREFARGADLVFVDPDNGLPVKSVRPGTQKFPKFVAMEELQALYEDGHSLLIYQHTARTSRRDLIRAKLKDLYEAFEIEHFTSLFAWDWVAFLVTNAGRELELGKATDRIMVEWATGIHVANNVVIPVSATPAEIKARPERAFRKRLTRLTTEIGFINRNRQEVVRKTDLPGTDHGQRIYVLRCGACETEYGTNGSTIYLAKCPSCQQGAAGLPFV
ncbi:MAG: hypothetical protein M3P06_17505 [Acidobacteriota bacterium]|nr:hypothetical protein [Acidobacteriota bacterium]